MSKICSKCSKTVYPLEELKCLDKVWHKGCFRCWECGMTLNMKNYKGYEKKPYCSSHYPHMKATIVADTPELQRIAQNTKLQSQVKYHEDFEKNIKGSKIQVSDYPELSRVKQVNHLVSQVEYKAGVKPATATKGEKWMPGPVSNGGGAAKPSPYSERTTSHSTTYSAAGAKVEGVQRVKRIGSIADYDPVNDNYGSLTQGYRPSSTSRNSQEWEEVVPLTPKITSGRSSASSVSTSGIGSSSEVESQQQSSNPALNSEEVFANRSETPVASDSQVIDSVIAESEVITESEITNVDSISEGANSSHEVANSSNDGANSSNEVEDTSHDSNEQSGNEQIVVNEEEDEEPGTSLNGLAFVTLYDYDEQDEDEVTFVEGDMMIDVRSIDDGWMYGTVKRTGQRGMFPANYVEKLC